MVASPLTAASGLGIVDGYVAFGPEGRLGLVSRGNDMPNKCLRCGSEKLMHDMPLRDSYGDTGAFTKPAEVHVHGNPSAWIFKETSKGELSLTVCGECGHAELHVDNFRELYEKHVRTRQAGE